MTASTTTNNKMMKSTGEYNHPRECDVICARGKNFNSHLGNEVFLKAVRANLKEYTEADGRFEKTLIVSHMLATFRESGIRFFRLADVPSSAKMKKKKCCAEILKCQFNEINDERKIHEKIGHAFRDMLRAQSCSRSATTATKKTCKKKYTSPLGAFPASVEHRQNSDSFSSCQDQGESVTEKQKPFFHPPLQSISEGNQDTKSEERSEVTSTEQSTMNTSLVETEYFDINPADWEELTYIDDDLVPHGIDFTLFPESKHSAVTRCHTNDDSSESLNQEEEPEFADDLTTASMPLPPLQFWEDDHHNDEDDPSMKVLLDGLEKWMDTKKCTSPEEIIKVSLKINSEATEHPPVAEDPRQYETTTILNEDSAFLDAKQQDFPQCRNPLSQLEDDVGNFDLGTLLDESHNDDF